VRWRYTTSAVSILVVLDLALQPYCLTGNAKTDEGFNPCCIGFSVATPPYRKFSTLTELCFNPCCIGFSVATWTNRRSPRCVYRVSILVVLDLALQQSDPDTGAGKSSGFNPCCIGFSVATANFERQ